MATKNSNYDGAPEVLIDWTAGGDNCLSQAERDARQAEIEAALASETALPTTEAEYGALQDRAEAIANRGLERDSSPSPACVTLTWGGMRWASES